MAEDSLFKKWRDAIDAKNDADFKKGVLQNIRELKQEVYNLKVDTFNNSQGTLIRDDHRIVLSAPEIVIGDVNLGGQLNPASQSTIIIRGNNVAVQGVGDNGEVKIQAPAIQQIAENAGIDGNEHIIGDFSKVVTQAQDITLESDTVSKGGAFPTADVITGGGIRFNADHAVEVTAAKSLTTRLANVNRRLQELEAAKTSFENEVKTKGDEYNAKREEVDDLMKKRQQLKTGELDIRSDYRDLDEMNIRINELSDGLSKSIYEYADALSNLGETLRLIALFKKHAHDLEQVDEDNFRKSTNTYVAIQGEMVNVATMDGDGKFLSNENAGVNLLTNTMMIASQPDQEDKLPDNNRMEINMKNIEIITGATKQVTVNNDGVVESAKMPAEGEVLIRSKAITMESVDYEIDQKKKKESGLAGNGKIKIRSNDIELNTATSTKMEVDEDGVITQAKYLPQGNVTIKSKNFQLKAYETAFDGTKEENTALVQSSFFGVNTELVNVSAVDQEGKAKGMIYANAKDVYLISANTNKDSGKAETLAEQGNLVMLGENVKLGTYSQNMKSKTVQMATEEVLIAGEKLIEAQQGDKAVLQLTDGHAALAGDKTLIYGETTINAKTEIKGELAAPKAVINNIEASSSFKSPNISDGMAAGGGGGGGSLSAKKKVEDAEAKEAQPEKETEQ